MAMTLKDAMEVQNLAEANSGGRVKATVSPAAGNEIRGCDALYNVYLHGDGFELRISHGNNRARAVLICLAHDIGKMMSSGEWTEYDPHRAEKVA